MSRAQSNGTHVRGAVVPTTDERFLGYKAQLHQQLIASMDLSTIGTMSAMETMPRTCVTSGRNSPLSGLTQRSAVAFGPLARVSPLPPCSTNPFTSR